MSLDNFSIVPLKDVVKRVKVGFVGSCNKDYCSPDEGVPMIRTTNLSKEGIKLENLKYISKEFHKKNSKSQINFGDILIARHGHNGLASLWEHNFEAQCLNVVIVETDDSLADKHYLTYLINSSIIQNQIKSLTGGSVQSVVNTKDIADLEIPLPSLKKQREISSFISLFDKKIKVNKTLNKNLSNISSNIFSYLIRKEENNEFLELNKVCKFIKGKKPNEISEKYENDFLNYLTIEVLSNQNQLYAYDKKGIKVNEYDILMVMDGASSGKLFYGKTGLVGSTLSKVEVKEDYLELIYQFLKLNEKFISDNTTGSAIPHVDKGLVLNLKCPISKELLNYSTTFKNIRAAIIENNKEILKLQKLRDTLLPNLMSGELDVSEVNCDLD